MKKIGKEKKNTKIKTSFYGHEKFECKIDWLTKGLKAFSKNNKIFNPMNIEEGIETLGLGVNMIKSLNHWMKVFGLIEKSNFTDLGNILLERDLYFENNDTLWLLHWNIVKNQERATLYNLFFNTIYPNKFTKEDILNQVTSWLEQEDIKLSLTTIKSDIDVFIRMYRTNDRGKTSFNLFSELKLITEQSAGIYALNINNAADITDYAFTYILLDYIEAINRTRSESVSMDDIQRGKLSLQKSLCMGENTLYQKIYRLEQLTKGGLAYSEASGIRQIYINGLINKTTLLHGIYK